MIICCRVVLYYYCSHGCFKKEDYYFLSQSSLTITVVMAVSKTVLYECAADKVSQWIVFYENTLIMHMQCPKLVKWFIVHLWWTLSMFNIIVCNITVINNENGFKS